MTILCIYILHGIMWLYVLSILGTYYAFSYSLLDVSSTYGSKGKSLA